MPAKVNAHSGQVAEYFTYSALVSCTGTNGDSSVGTIMRYRFTHNAITIINETSAIRLGVLVLGIDIIVIGIIMPERWQTMSTIHTR